MHPRVSPDLCCGLPLPAPRSIVIHLH
jgi:hypothetical protein